MQWRKIADEIPEPTAVCDRSGDEFWEDFRAHARMVPQLTDPEPGRAVAWRWAWVAACAIVIAAVAGLPATRDREELGGVVRSIEVVAKYESILILSDELSDSTIVWIVDMQDDRNEGDSA